MIATPYHKELPFSNWKILFVGLLMLTGSASRDGELKFVSENVIVFVCLVVFPAVLPITIVSKQIRLITFLCAGKENVTLFIEFLSGNPVLL